jgi:glycosyltransferase involved in cell wall biosynthesis
VIEPYLDPATRLHHVPNPVTVARNRRVEAEANEVFLFVGRLAKEKGAVQFARAAAQAGIRAVLVGDGPERDAVRAANPDAELVGWLSSEEVARWMDRARCLVFPSLWYETLGLAPLEALVRGVPVICGSWCAASEFVEDGVTGIVHDEPGELADALRSMTDAFAGFASRNAFDAGDRFGHPVEDHVDRLLTLYECILARQPDRRPCGCASPVVEA